MPYRVYVIQLRHTFIRGAMSFCLAVSTGSDPRRGPIGNVYFAQGCPMRGFHFTIMRNVFFSSLERYEGRVFVGEISSQALGHLEQELEFVDLQDGENWVFRALRRLAAQGFPIETYHQDPILRRLGDARRAWERGED